MSNETKWVDPIQERRAQRRALMQQLISNPDALADFLCSLLEQQDKEYFIEGAGWYHEDAHLDDQLSRLRSFINIDRVTNKRREHT